MLLPLLFQSKIARSLGSAAVLALVGLGVFIIASNVITGYKTTAEKLVATELAAKRAQEIAENQQRAQEVMQRQLEDRLEAVRATLDRRAESTKELGHALDEINRMRAANGPAACPTDPAIVYALLRASRDRGGAQGSEGAGGPDAGRGAP